MGQPADAAGAGSPSTPSGWQSKQGHPVQPVWRGQWRRGNNKAVRSAVTEKVPDQHPGLPASFLCRSRPREVSSTEAAMASARCWLRRWWHLRRARKMLPLAHGRKSQSAWPHQASSRPDACGMTGPRRCWQECRNRPVVSALAIVVGLIRVSSIPVVGRAGGGSAVPRRPVINPGRALWPGRR